MPATRSVSRESCRGSVQDARTAAGARTHRTCHARLGPTYSAPLETMTDMFGVPVTRRRGLSYRPRAWETDAADLEAKATEAGLTAADMLCVGCNRRRVRLIAAGMWLA